MLDLLRGPLASLPQAQPGSPGRGFSFGPAPFQPDPRYVPEQGGVRGLVSGQSIRRTQVLPRRRRPLPERHSLSRIGASRGNPASPLALRHSEGGRGRIAGRAGKTAWAFSRGGGRGARCRVAAGPAPDSILGALREAGRRN